MKKLYRTREGSITAVDTRTQLTTVGSESAPGPLLVPNEMKYIIGLIVSQCQSQTVATGYSAFCRLEGAGLQNGPEAIAVGAGGNNVATGGAGSLQAKYIPVNFPVVSGNEVLIFGEMAGTDVGSLEMSITVVFADELPQGAVVERTFTVEGDIASADTKTNLTTQGSVTAPSPVVPSGVTKISKIIYAVAGDGLADGFQSIFLRLGGNAVLGGEQVITLGSTSRVAVQAGSDSAPQMTNAVVLENLDIEVRANDTIAVAVEGAGTDSGTPHVVTTLVYA